MVKPPGLTIPVFVMFDNIVDRSSLKILPVAFWTDNVH